MATGVVVGYFGLPYLPGHHERTVSEGFKDSKLTQIYTGTNQITRMVTGRALLFP